MQISNAPAGGAAAETGSYTYDASGRMLSGRDDKRDAVVSALTYDANGNLAFLDRGRIRPGVRS